MKLIFRGAAREVGRSCIEVQTNDERYLLDCGVKFKEGGFAYPKGVFDVPDIDGVFLSHAHLDHSGGLPFFEHKNLKEPIFCTAQTFALTKILLKDSFEIARLRHMHPAFSRVDLKEVRRDTHLVNFDKPFKHKSLQVTFFNAGHIPGSASILLELEGKRLLYTGDINVAENYLIHRARPDYGKPIDILITESTYGYRDLPDRMEIAERFLDRIEEVINAGGSVLIPVFAVGRAQEVLQILSKRSFKAPIYYDGMAKKVTGQVLRNPSKYVKNKDMLAKEYYDIAQSPKGREHREMIAQEQGIFVTTSGMLQGGPVLTYVKHMWHDPKNAIFLSGYQCKRTNGRLLLDEGVVYIKGWRTEVKCQVEKFDFSGHSDRTHLKEFIKAINPKVLICQHGDEESVEAMAAWAKEELGIPTYAPALLDEIEL